LQGGVRVLTLRAANRADVFETALGSIGMILCYDGDFPELSRLLAVKGAEVIVRPSALLRSFDIWYITNAARAYDNHVYVVATNSVGPDAGGSYYFGHSMIVNPIAWRLAQARGGEEIIAAKLDPDPLRYVTCRVREQTIQSRGVCGLALEFRVVWEGLLGKCCCRQPDSGEIHPERSRGTDRPG
jgi:predicted amidohydrolase